MANPVQRRVGAIALLIAAGILQGLPRDKADRAAVFAAEAGPPSNPQNLPPAHALAGLPMSFEANGGQAQQSVKFLSRGPGYTLFLTDRAAVLSLSRPSIEGSTVPKAATVRMELDGGRHAPAVTPLDELPGKSNYLIGNDPARWRTNVPTFAKVKYSEVYRGIDLIYYGRGPQLEFDFLVAPGAEPRDIRLAFSGVSAMQLTGRGDLLLRTEAGDVRFDKPVTYQESGGERMEVASEYVLFDGSRVGFKIGAYDRTRPLVIDPVLQYATFLGGSRHDVRHTLGETVKSLAVDDAGNLYLAGETDSSDFPLADPLQPEISLVPHLLDAFVAKLNPAGTALLYSTYIGGSGLDTADGIALDAAGNIYISGFTSSADFPTANALYPEPGTVFLTKIDSTGSSLVYSTYFGRGVSHGLAVDPSGNAYITGSTESLDFPVQNAVQPSFAGGSADAFVAKFDPRGALIYSTFLGGSAQDAGVDIAADADGHAYAVGNTTSADFPTANAMQSALRGAEPDVYVAKLDSTGGVLVYSTYVGGSDIDFAGAIAVDTAGNVYIGGGTESSDFPIVSPLQATLGGWSDAFVAKLNSAGSAFEFATFLGGDHHEGALDIAVDAAGRAHIAGYTLSNNFPVANALQPAHGGEWDGFVAALNAPGSTLTYSTFLGSSDYDEVVAIAVDGAGGAYVGGYTQSVYFPTASPLQPRLAGNADAFVAKITDVLRPALISLSSTAASQGETIPLTLSGLNFTNGATVSVSGTGVSVGTIVVQSPTTLLTTLTIENTAPPDVRDVIVTTPEGTSNRRALTIWSSTPGCRVSLPVAVHGTVSEVRVRVGLGTAEPIEGLWLLGALVPDGDTVKVLGQGIHQGAFPAIDPPLTRWSALQIDAPVVGVMNAFILNPHTNPQVCAHTVELTPGVSSSAARRQAVEDGLVAMTQHARTQRRNGAGAVAMLNAHDPARSSR